MKSLLAAAFAVSLLATGCNQQKFGLDGASQVFGQKAMYNSQVDILWVIDTSSSMDIYQNQLSPQMGVMVDALNTTGLDYHMAVTTMDFSANGEKGKFVNPDGASVVLTNATPNLTQVLQNRIRLGGNGSPVERGLEAMKSALSAPLAATNGFNSGFLRKDAMLVVIFLSNEDDQSTTADYGAFLDSIRPPLQATGERSWLVQFMGVVEADPTCTTSSWSNGIYHEFGDKYIALANQSGGLAASICTADLRQALTNVKARILEVITEYKLDRTPDLTSIAVYINGSLVPQDATNGWTYYSQNNSIRFHGTAVPPVDSTIKIDYSPTGIK